MTCLSQSVKDYLNNLYEFIFSYIRYYSIQLFFRKFFINFSQNFLNKKLLINMYNNQYINTLNLVTLIKPSPVSSNSLNKIINKSNNLKIHRNAAFNSSKVSSPQSSSSTSGSFSPVQQNDE